MENALSALLDLESFLLEIALFAHFCIRIALNVRLKLEVALCVLVTQLLNTGWTLRTFA